MGLGKTAQTIAVVARLLRRREIERALVVCPASLKHQWAQEIERLIDVPGVHSTVVRGGREARQALYRNPGPILITSYELLRADERQVAALAPDLLVLDEAQRLKNWRTRTSDVVKRIPTRRAIVLTGTPLQNRLDDLYSLMQVIDPHILGPLWRFNRDFALLDERGRPVGYKHLAELRARVSPVFLRRRKEDVLDQLPDRITTPVVLAVRQLGDVLERGVRLADGKLVAIVSDGASVPAEASTVALLPASAAAALAALGDSSPLARADVLHEKPGPGPAAVAPPWRTSALAAAARKQEAARILRQAGQSSEALPLLHASLVLLCRAAAPIDPGDDPAALLSAVYGGLVPEGALTAADAHALSRAAELSRAFAATPVAAPDALIEPLFRHAADLVSRLESRLNRPVLGEAPAASPSP